MLAQEVLVALQSVLDPELSNEQRLEYFRLTEEYKTKQFELGDLAVICAHDQHPTLILFGLQCLEYKIKHSWKETPVELKCTIKESLFQLTSNFHKFSCFSTHGKVITLILSQIFVHLIKCEWPQQWPSMLQEFMELQKIGAAQSKLMMNTLLRLYEDVVQFQGIPQSRRRDIMAGLNDSLGAIVNFAFGLVMQQLTVLESPDVSCHDEAISLCRDSLSMLTGFFDSCRMDVLYQWIPSGMPVTASVGGLPCGQLFTRLMCYRDLQLDTLNFLLLVMNRKNHHSGTTGETTTSFISRFVQDCQVGNTFCVLLRSAVDETPNYSDHLYTRLRLLSEVFVKLGLHIVSQWSSFESSAQPCNCNNYTCGNLANHILEGLLLLTTHPVRVISAVTLGFWTVALHLPGPTLSARIRPLLDSLFFAWQFGLIKDNSDLHKEWTLGVYEADEYSSFYCRYRGSLLKCLSLAASVWPRDFMRLLRDHKNLLLERSTPGARDGDVKSFLEDFEDVAEVSGLKTPVPFSGLELCLEHTLGSLKKSCLASNRIALVWSDALTLTEFASFVATSAEQCLLGVSLALEAGRREKMIVCATLLVQHLDDSWIESSVVESIVLRLVDQMFTALAWTPDLENGLAPVTAVGGGRAQAKSTQSLHLAVATAFFRLAQFQPDRLLPHFNLIQSEADLLWPSQDVGVMEKCILLEAFITLCFRLKHPIEILAHIMKQLLSQVNETWAGVVGTTPAQPSVMSQLLETCTNYGGAGLLSATGLDRPLESQDDPSPIAQQQPSPDGVAPSCTEVRRTLVHSVLWLLAAVRRLVEPITDEQREKLTLPSLEPLLTPTLVLIKAFNELWLPQTMARVHPTVLPAFEMSEHIKYHTLCLQINRTETSEMTGESGEKSTLGYLHSFLHSCHDNLMTAFGLLLTGLGQRLYALPTDQLAVALHQGCCAAFEQLPDLKVANLIRLVIRPYMLHCPKQYLATAVVPLVPPILGAVVQRLDVRWQQLSALNDEDTQNDQAITEEMVKERLTRLLSRSCLDMIRLLFTFNGFERHPTSTTTSGTKEVMEDENEVSLRDEGDDAADVEMTSEVKAAGQPSVSSLGCLAQQMASLAVTATGLGADPLMLCSLVRCLAWPDSSSCLKAAQWICPLVDQVKPDNDGQPILPTPHQLLKAMEAVGDPATAPINPLHLPVELAELLFHGVLAGLHVNGKSVDSNLHSLLSAAVHIYCSVEPQLARSRLSPVIRQALLTSIQLAGSDNDTLAAGEIDTAIKTLEDQLISNDKKPLAVKTKRDMFKKVIQPLIGVPLSQRFRDQVCIASLAPAQRPGAWRHSNWVNTAQQDDDFGLTSLFSIS